MKKRKLILSSLIILLFGGYYTTKYIFPYSIIKPYRANPNIGLNGFDLNTSIFNISTQDSLTLKGWLIKTPKKAKATIILVHGIGSCKEHMLPLANSLSEKGFNSFVFDGRAHGKSDGDYCTYGFFEKQDISNIINRLQKLYPDIKIGIYGHSLGGAIAIQSLANDKRISFGVIESTFTSLSQVVYDYKKRYLFGIGIRSLSNYILNNAGDIAKFNPNKVTPLQDVTKVEQPILFSHGEADKRISVEYGKKLFNSCSSNNKQLILIPKAGHNSIRSIGGKKYENQVLDFLNKVTNNN